jgi:general secretion pathway protein G
MSEESNQPSRRGQIFLFLCWLVLFLGFAAYFDLSSHSGVEDAARYNSTKAQINTLKAVLLAFNKRTDAWPTSKEGLLVLTQPKPDPKNTETSVCLLKPSALVDPWGSDFQYAYPAQRSKDAFDLWSMGADKRSGTDDDIGNWTQTATK